MKNPQKEARITAIIAYLTIVGALIAITMNSEPKYTFARFHCRQAFGLHLGFLGFALFLSVWFNQYAWYGLYVGYFALWLYGFLSAINNKMNPVPFLGEYFQKWFTFIS
ncbi:hypothetical protein [Robiginitalea sp. IMCC43444]|uniref:hypothetical protein n=1 Tax=Robiginitalea sp. IMCC43444 TaxID=3459121 RepID=UPI004043714F